MKEQFSGSLFSKNGSSDVTFLTLEACRYVEILEDPPRS